MRAIPIGLLALVSLGGCTGLAPSDPATPGSAAGTGWSVMLERPLVIPAEAATVRLQYGRIVPRNGVQDPDPFCVVELDTVSESPQTLSPGRFEVVRVSRSVSTLVQRATPFRQVGLGDEDSPSFLYFITEFQLRDPGQPDLRAMTCAWNQMAPGNRALMRHLRLDEIRSALGDWIRVTPPGSLP